MELPTTTIEKSNSLESLSSNEVRVIGSDEYMGATMCLAEAFAKDDLARYFYDTPDMESRSEEEKWKLHVDILRYIVAAHCCKGITTTIGPNYDSVALWMPPGENVDDWWTIFRSGMWRLWFQLSREGRTRFYTEFMPLLHDTKADVLGPRDDDSYYLVYIGTRPGSQGKGYAKKLIDHMTKRADAEGRATYLESSSKKNTRYYRKFGFEFKREIAMIRGPNPVQLDIMVREPMNSCITGSSKLKGGVMTIHSAGSQTHA